MATRSPLRSLVLLFSLLFALAVPGLGVPTKRADTHPQQDDNQDTNCEAPTPETPVSDVKLHYVSDHGCSDDQKKIIQEEIRFAIDLASTAKNDLHRDYYYKKFFPDSLTGKDGFDTSVTDIYGRIATFWTGNHPQHYANLTCTPSKNSKCQNPRIAAFMTVKEKRVTFCKPFFSPDSIETTDLGSFSTTEELLSSFA
ncbi:hypothetical protein NUU61_000172 [Penicillium alfredii]|uniref:Uncharacterized protein n=1 Tax=Penicillium alfredii TaxID=1506179 RepID=A0A9W9G982_9EURO|nr:uncharacterized protein NUU61_000172 [Penicillium alfredii]KAJ5114413.1 hypothetical protein NUU61_000172 [Penicillium alfredii]